MSERLSMPNLWRKIGLWFSGFLIGIFLMVTDHLINLAQQGVKTYPYPLVGAFTIWTAWEIAFAGVLAGIIIGLLSIQFREGD